MRERAARAVAACLLIAGLASCSRLLGLPDVPADVTVEQAGIEGLVACSTRARRLEVPLRSEELQSFARELPDDALDKARWADHLWRAEGRSADAIAVMGRAVAQAPRDLVLGNRYRMLVHESKLRYLRERKAAGERAPELPGYLALEPFALLGRVRSESPGREVALQVALAHVDTMVLHAALEIKAPASIDSVRVLSSILEREPFYIPALFARGMNHLNRPRNLVWPEHPAPAPDAASRDFGLAAAVGLQVGGAPASLRGLLLLELGDACAREERTGLARSWWLAARETTRDRRVLDEIAVRMSWVDDDVADHLELRLQERMEDREHPVSDLSFLWSEPDGPDR